MKPIIHDLQQGSEPWLRFRTEHFGASEAAPMLGLSKAMSREDLLKLKLFGVGQQHSEWFEENVLKRGHRVEAIARPLAEEYLDDTLYPITCSQPGSKLSASCDGITLDGDTAWEAKQWNADLVEFVRTMDSVPDTHMPQCQQILLVTGAKRLIFTVSDGTKENTVHVEILPDPVWFQRITIGWAQFEADMVDYHEAPVTPAVSANVIESLPALTVTVEGKVLASNLGAYRTAAMTFIERIKTDLQTDQDFADADRTVKFCKDAEERLAAAKQQALGQTATIDELFRTIDAVSESLRQKRLELSKKVTTKKDEIRGEIVAGCQVELDKHIAALNTRLGSNWIPRTLAPFGDAIKGLKTVDSIREKANGVLVRAKIDASALADRLEMNRKALHRDGKDWFFLFADFSSVGAKEAEDFSAIASHRIAQQESAERVAAARRQAEAAARAAVVPSPAAQPVAAAKPPALAPTARANPTLKLGTIAERLGFTLTADFLTSLGFAPTQVGASKLYHDADFPRMCDALIARVVRAKLGETAEA